MTHIYNIIAGLCSDVINLCTDDSLFVRYSCISSSAKNLITENIYKAVPHLFLPCKDAGELPLIRQLKKEDMDDSFFDTLKSYIREIKKQPDLFSMIGLLQVLDEGLETLLLEKTEEYQRDHFTVVLNTNRESTGVGLLPRCSCIWERKHRLSHSYNRLDNFLFHFLLLENKILGDLIDKHYFFKHEMFPDLIENQGLRIAVSPLRLECHFDLEGFEDNCVQYFRVSYNDTFFERDNELIWQKILLSAKNKSDIIVFPEMLGNPETTGYISEKLKALSSEEQMKMPALIILPSVYLKKRNTVVILDREGKVICGQSKQNPFRAENGEDSHLEAIASNNVVNIFHYEGIGRIAVLICKDFLTTSYMEQLMRCFKLTLIIVPSFSTGSYDFIQSFDVCAHDDCNVVWINTCAALVPGKEANFENIGYVRKRIGRSDDASQKLCKMPICDGAFSGKCMHDCIYFEKIQGV